MDQISLEGKGFEFCPEVTAKVANLGIDIKEVPIHYRPRAFSEGKKIRPKDGVIAIKTLFKYSFLTAKTKHDLTAGLEATQLARNYNSWLFGHIKRYIKGSVLEAGAGIGTIADRLINNGVNKLLLGEIDQTYLKRLSIKYKGLSQVVVTKLDITSKKSIGRLPKIDTIISVNTLEHIKDDGETISLLAGRLNPGGYMIIFVPAFQILFGKWDKSIGHIRRYNKSELLNKINRAGLVPKRTRFMNIPGFFGWGVNSLLGNTPKQQGTQKQILIFDRFILPWWSKIEDLINPFFGQSLLVVAKKPKNS